MFGLKEKASFLICDFCEDVVTRQCWGLSLTYVNRMHPESQRSRSNQSSTSEQGTSIKTISMNYVFSHLLSRISHSIRPEEGEPKWRHYQWNFMEDHEAELYLACESHRIEPPFDMFNAQSIVVSR